MPQKIAFCTRNAAAQYFNAQILGVIDYILIIN
jgi:hypothetical protein